MKISVALCTYNGEVFLSRQLESILKQTVPVQEIVITDDNSTDNTPVIIREYQEQFPNIIHCKVNNPGLGIQRNFEKALSLCTGNIILLSDQDDIWLPNKVAVMTNHFESHPTVEALFTDGYIINDNDEMTGGTLFSKNNFDINVQQQWRRNDIASKMVTSSNKITGATMAIRKELLLRSFPFDLPSDLWHDFWLGLHAVFNNGLDWINEPLIKYRVHARQQVGLGEGLFLQQSNSDGSLKAVLERWNSSARGQLKVFQILKTKYSSPVIEDLCTDNVNALNLLQHRLNLPSNILKRTLSVVKNTSLYNKASQLRLRVILRDILKPA